MRAGELYLVDFGPAARGVEQAAIRPAMVVHSDGYRRIPGLALVCPMTKTERGVPNHVLIPPTAQTGLTARSYVMTEQIRAVDRQFVGARLGQAPTDVLTSVLRILHDRMIARA